MAMNDLIRRGYAPTGSLRVALNFGNRVLVGRDASGLPSGISVDLARGLAQAIGCELEFLEYDRAIDVSDSAEAGVWDVCFLAVDPKRGETIEFTEPYVGISGCYLVGARVTAQNSPELVARGHSVGAVEGSAYTLHLSRQPGSDRLVPYPDIFAALAALDSGEVDAIAGIQQAMEGEAGLRPGSRVLQPPFMEIRQAMGLPVGRPEATSHLRAYLADLARSGTVGEILERHGVAASCAIIPAIASD